MKAATVEQLLVLADRAERGRLTAAEAARLRAGIAAMDRSRRSAWGRLGDAERVNRRRRDQVASLEFLVERTQQRRLRVVRLSMLVALLGKSGAGEAAEQPHGRRSVPV